MKFTAIFLLATCLVAGATGHAQKVTLSFKDAPLEKVFTSIKQQTGYVFFYSYDQLSDAKTVTVDIKNKSINEALQICLQGQPFGFTIEDKTIFITRKNRADIDKQELVPPPIDIKGRIVNEEGEGVVANIIVKGTQNGTTSNSDGHFELKGVDENASLVITGISIEAIEIRVNGRTNFTINAKTKIVEGEDVIVKTNYWETKKKLNPGNISKVTAKEIQQQPVQNPIAALMGRISGLEIVQQTGVAGGNFRVRIRGTNSIANGNDPLYVIDGIPFTSTTMAFNETSSGIYGNANSEGGTSPLNAINPADIESIEVLKDADATAIYGSRGANGVILITTKKGVPGKSKLDLNFYSGAGKVTRKMDLLNTEQYREMRTEALKNASFWPLPPSLYQYVPDVFIWDSTRYTDWQKELIGGNANTTDAQFAFSGGDKFTQFVIGGGYHHETTVFPGNNSDRRLSTHFNLNNLSQNQRLRTSLSFNYAAGSTDLLKVDLTNAALTLPPNAPPLYTSSGDFNWGSTSGTNTWYYPTLIHPLSYLRTRYEATTKNLLLNASASYSILPGFEAKINTGMSDVRMDAITITPKSSYPPTVTADNSTSFATSNFRNWTVEPQLNWDKSIQQGKLSILIGMTFLEQVQEGLAQIAYGFTSEALMRNLAAASSRFATTSYYSQYRYNAGFARINYISKERYIINITGRRDGSSRFGAGRQFANFGAIGTAWLFSRENFIRESLPFISFGKLRASYGITGNDQLSNYQYLDSYIPSASSYPSQGGVIGLTPARLANTDFAWETNRKLEAAIELSFFNDRIESSVSYYRNRSSNQLVGQPLPPTTGFNTVQSNFPAVVQNTGIEIELLTRNIKHSNFEWTTSINLSIPRNKLVAFPDIEASPEYANTLIIGRPLSISKRYIYNGINDQTGLYQFQDINGDGVISLPDKEGILFIGQQFSGGLQNSISYKGFQLDILFQFVKQTGSNYINIFSYPGTMQNEPTWVLDRWRKPGDQANTQMFNILASASEAYTRAQNSTLNFGDASFIRLKNLFLSYSLPPRWIGKLHGQTARIFIQGQNLLTITGYQGLDPETGSYSLPPLRVMAGGFQLIF